MNSVLAGIIIAAAVSAGAVLTAFARPARRFLYGLVFGHTQYADRLAAGIALTAAGTLLIGFATVVKMATGTAIYPLYWIAWVIIASGYFFHFTAWRAAHTGRGGSFTLAWATVLLIVALVAMLLANSLLPS